MEAAVLGPAVMTDVDCNSNSLNAELEVKKLQELVRKLERQNEQLRSRAGGCLSGGYHHLPTLLCQASLGSFSPPEEPFEYFQPHAGEEVEEEGEASEPSVLDELELLDLESLSCSEESDETWLYAASKALESSTESLSPLQWCRQNLDSPKSDVEAARRSLSLRLEQVSRWCSSLSTPTTSPGPPLTRATAVSSPSARRCSTPPPAEPHAPFLSSPLHPVLHRTLSPIGKELSPVAERTPTFFPHPASRSRSLRRFTLSPQSSVDSDLGMSEVEDDSISLGYKLQDLTDVQVMARLQEESLRQDYASTSSVLANRRSQSFTFQLSHLCAGPGLEEEDEEDDEDYGLLPPPQPRLTRLPHSHTFSSVRDWRRSTSSLCTPPSTPSTPPYPSAGFAFQAQPPTQLLGLGSLCGGDQLGFSPGSVENDNKLRRSMPNLVRAPSMPSVPILTTSSTSASFLRNSQSFDSSSSLARLQSSIPSPGQLQNRVQSLGNFASLSRQPLKATAYVSPTIKGSTSTSLTSLNSSGNNSGIPLLSKPAGGGSAPTATILRSSLPRPASFMGPTSSSPRSKLAVSSRSLLTPPKSLSTFSALRDSTWRDGCY
ncbi:SLAIN motif-containing protein 1-like isoform X2 [Girardinichthys multiradiatus]|uniref:SLAIN motif-containing protein 1-like isoform X2 n=1 Tax=Girardinichthys multiradiatus TaxID=208333 RepID=UPI001FABCF73|nr:SLAIN motif-containing protein 1-like isoform X2 [Girardinichthys multiradiatus]